MNVVDGEGKSGGVWSIDSLVSFFMNDTFLKSSEM